MQKITSGEQLFFLIKDEILLSTGNKHVNWVTIKNFFDHSGERAEFTEYLRGALSVHIVRKLLRYWSEEKNNVASESNYVKNVSRFIKEETFPSLDHDGITKLSRAVIKAENSSYKPITKSVRTNVLGKSSVHYCYLCNRSLDKTHPVGAPGHLTLEHLWPTSIGGDSIEENLLPACTSCQDHTKDTMSWEWINVQNIVLPVRPSNEALVSITNKQRVAKHFQYAIEFCHANKVSLKEAFLRIGPIKYPLTHLMTGSPITFFDIETA